MAGGVFKRQNTKFKGAISSDTAVLTVGGEQGLQLGIVQSLGVQFGQSISRIYDVSNGGGPAGNGGGATVPVYYVGGRAQGSASIARVMGPTSAELCKFYQNMSDVCDPQDLNFTFEAGCDGKTKAKTMWGITDAVIQSMQIGVAAENMVINENLSLMFANLECS